MLLRLVLAGCVLCSALLAPPAAAQGADGTTLETALLDVLLERGIITIEEHGELLALARARVEARNGEFDLMEARLERLRAPDVQSSGGSSGKLLFKSPDGKWSLGLKGRVQARIEHMDSEDEAEDGNNFSVPRSRLTAEGNAGSPTTTFRLDADMPTQRNQVDPASEPGFNLRDAYVNFGSWAVAALRFGQFKFPFGREMLISSASLSLQERSVASNEFSPNFEPGAMLHGQVAEGLLTWALAIANGEGRSKNNTPGDEVNGLRTGGRVTFNPLGAVKSDGPAFQTLETGEARLSLGANYMTNEDSSSLATATADSDSATLGYDLQFFWGPFSLLAEVFDRQADVDGGADVDDDGHVLQAGWLLTPEWEVVARQSEVDYDAEDDALEAALGVNWYLDQHAGKWQFDISRLDNGGTTADARRLRLMYQLLF
jgi:phosphate-selective porin OprO and OprP